MAVGVGGGGGEEVGTFSKDINFYKIEQEILFYMIDELILSWIVFLVASRIPYRRKVEQWHSVIYQIFYSRPSKF